ncbi:MAG: hypothetical protein QM770_02270 [Tepidisphaeraceae bacterium]
MRKIVNRRPIETLEERRLMATGSILFIRGADRSGGALLTNPTDAQRTEQMSSINNTSEAAGNHGWGQLKSLLTSVGYTVTEVAEQIENGAAGTGVVNGTAIDLTALNLSQYKMVVFGSNNAQNYSTPSINAVDTYVRNGGGALFISDGNWGSSWSDAASSDQLFLNRFGWTMNQDRNSGVTVSSAGDIKNTSLGLLNNVSSFQAEGDSSITVGSPASGQTNTIVAGVTAAGGLRQVRQNNGAPGTLRTADTSDASLVVATVGSGRIGAFYDRNSWFNGNGSGTDLGKAGNQTLALNLFGYLTQQAVDTTRADAVAVTQGSNRPYRVVQLTFNVNLGASVTKDDVVIQRRKDKRTMSGSYWKFSTFLDGQGRTVIQARVTKDDLQGKYNIVVLNGSVFGPSGLANDHEIKVGWFLEPTTSGASVASVPVSGTVFTGAIAGASGLFASDDSVLA